VTITKQLLAIPAASTVSKRFSVARRALSERRVRMQPETLEKLDVSEVQYVVDKLLPVIFCLCCVNIQH